MYCSPKKLPSVSTDSVHLFLKDVPLIGKHAGQDTFILLRGNASAKGIVYSSCTLESCPVAQWQLNTSISKRRRIHKFPYQQKMWGRLSQGWGLYVRPLQADSPEHFQYTPWLLMTCSTLEPNHKPPNSINTTTRTQV